MIVTIPRLQEHNGYEGNLMTIEISDQCPVCGGPRGEKRWRGLSYDGSRRLAVECWENACGHVDGYGAVRVEYFKGLIAKDREGSNEDNNQDSPVKMVKVCGNQYPNEPCFYPECLKNSVTMCSQKPAEDNGSS
jgi:hypothetical protein